MAEFFSHGIEIKCNWIVKRQRKTQKMGGSVEGGRRERNSEKREGVTV